MQLRVGTHLLMPVRPKKIRARLLVEALPHTPRRGARNPLTAVTSRCSTDRSCVPSGHPPSGFCLQSSGSDFGLNLSLNLSLTLQSVCATSITRRLRFRAKSRFRFSSSQKFEREARSGKGQKRERPEAGKARLACAAGAEEMLNRLHRKAAPHDPLPLHSDHSRALACSRRTNIISGLLHLASVNTGNWTT
jgi:hypothetical protein